MWLLGTSGLLLWASTRGWRWMSTLGAISQMVYINIASPASYLTDGQYLLLMIVVGFCSVICIANGIRSKNLHRA